MNLFLPRPPAPSPRHPQAGTRSLSRSAFTLLEVLLTLSIVVAMAAMTWPSIHGAFQSQRMRTAADRVVSGFNKARALAMESGEPQSFRCQVGAAGFTIEPACATAAPATDVGTDYSGSVAESNNASLAAPDSVVGSNDSTLPAPVTFLNCQTQTAAGAPPVNGADAAATPIIFFPDGSATNAEVTLVGWRERCLKISLRGLTGVATVGTVTSREGMQ